MDSSSGFTCELLQELKKHFETDPNPDEATLEALADALKLTKGDIRIWFLYGKHEMELKQLSRAKPLSWSLGNIVFCLNLSEAMGQSVA